MSGTLGKVAGGCEINPCLGAMLSRGRSSIPPTLGWGGQEVWDEPPQHNTASPRGMHQLPHH